MTDHPPLAAVVWPAGQKSLALRALADCGAVPRTALRAPGAEADRLIIETGSFPAAAISRFEAAVTAGKAEDSAPGFARFASEFFSRLDAFLTGWTTGRDETSLIVPVTALRADPASWMPRLLAFSGASDRVPASDALAAAESVLSGSPAQDLTQFRYYDPELFERLDRLVLRREIVLDIFRKVMGRDLEERSVLHFQGAASRESLRATLTGSAEYRQRRAPGGVSTRPQPAASRASADQPPVLVHLHIPKSAGTSLTSILAGNFGPGEKFALDVHNIDRLRQMPERQRAKLRLIFGHLPHGMVGPALDRPVIHVVALRQPGPRLLSYYRYMKRREDHPLFPMLNGADMSFGAFLEFCEANPEQRPEADNGQMRRLAGRLAPEGLGREPDLFRAALRNTFAPDMVFGLTERFDALLDDLVARGLIRSYEPVVANAAPEAASFEEARAALTPEQDAILSGFTRWDQKLYDICETYLFGLEPQTGH